MRSSDPVRYAMIHDNEAEAWLQSRPVCVRCGEHIQDEDLYDLDGDYYCEDCANDWLKEHRRSVENIMIWG